MDKLTTTCEDCTSQVEVTFSPYGSSYMAEIACPKCGISYDTNLSDEDIALIFKTRKPLFTDQELDKLLLDPYCGDHLVPVTECNCLKS